MTAKHRHPSKWAGKKIFTTGEAAAICQISQQTVIRCFDSGRLGGFRVPGSRFRRITREDLIRFMHANGISTQALEGAGIRVIVIDEVGAAEQAAGLLSKDQRLSVRSASHAFDAGALHEAFRPTVALVAGRLPDAAGICARLKSHASPPTVLALIEPGRQSAGLRQAGADEIVARPVDAATLIARCVALAQTRA